MSARRGSTKGLITDAVCSCGGSVRSLCCGPTANARCPLGVCETCGRTWRRIPAAPLCALGAGTRDAAGTPPVRPLRDYHPGNPDGLAVTWGPR